MEHLEVNSVVLEPSTNTHVMEAQEVVKEDLGEGILKLKVKGEGVVTHGEHGTLKTQSEHVMKYVQQEVNPVTRRLQNAFD
jgi:hypothetical protein